ncbi:hypothetical protein AOXY_G3251 [Acipenser oxyrinchus oxyrinchus]|uniref:Uncharacterized protein n=1 Tax=Acipenser oxyrinchus oxyrinchus TaxID=40147 RepID=A0AAD8GEU7_ACIOX|nr:hypothetical protein AOXY_G3251 [Acipenser oxyrinchus oxyrinchus]
MTNLQQLNQDRTYRLTPLPGSESVETHHLQTAAEREREREKHEKRLKIVCNQAGKLVSIRAHRKAQDEQ